MRLFIEETLYRTDNSNILDSQPTQSNYYRSLNKNQIKLIVETIESLEQHVEEMLNDIEIEIFSLLHSTNLK